MTSSVTAVAALRTISYRTTTHAYFTACCAPAFSSQASAGRDRYRDARRIFDVAVDLRPDSKSFGHWYGVELSDQGPRQLYMAPGFARGFCMLSESADLHYKVSRLTIMLTREGSSGTIPDLAIQWPIVDPILSRRDNCYPRLRHSIAHICHISNDPRLPPILGEPANRASD